MGYAELVESIERADRDGKSILDIPSDTEFPGVEWKSGSTFPAVHIRFTRVQFHGDVSFAGVTFQAGASFIDVDFWGKASFALCKFKGPAYFWKCRFHGEADFSHIVVSCENFRRSNYAAGELNFSYCIFEESAKFRHAVLYGPAYFWRTVFACKVDFEVAQFKDATQFMGRRHDIVVSERELPQGTLKLLSEPLARILVKCEDRDDGYYNFESTITSKDELEIRLKQKLPSPKKRRRNMLRGEAKPLLTTGSEKIIALWDSYHEKYMFNNEFVSNFMEVYFGSKSEFRHVSLRRSQFRRADLSNVRFDSVGWDKGYAGGRERLFDEVHLEENVKQFSAIEHTSKTEGEWIYRESIAVSNLYHQLRMRADVAGERSLARDFYYGEMEMARQAEAYRGQTTLAWMYMHLSGYGTRELRALTILLVLLLGFWPLVYMLLDIPHRADHQRGFCGEILSSEVTSLEAATFLLRPPALPGQNKDLDYTRRLAEGVERIVVSVQAGLFVLSLKSKFQRGPE